MSDTSGRDDDTPENKLARRIREGIKEAIGNDPSLRNLVSGDGIEYLVRRAARRTIANSDTPDEAVEQARRTYGRVARDIYKELGQRRNVTRPRRPAQRNEIERIVEIEDRICGVFPWC